MLHLAFFMSEKVLSQDTDMLLIVAGKWQKLATPLMGLWFLPIKLGLLFLVLKNVQC